MDWLETVISGAQAPTRPVEAGLVVRLPPGAAIELIKFIASGGRGGAAAGVGEGGVLISPED